MQHNSDYLRAQGVQYKERAEKARTSRARKELRELADVCEEVANKFEDLRASG